MVTQDNRACTELWSLWVDDVVNLETLQSEMAAKGDIPCPDSNWFHRFAPSRTGYLDLLNNRSNITYTITTTRLRTMLERKELESSSSVLFF
jgi:hypothetical protein